MSRRRGMGGEMKHVLPTTEYEATRARLLSRGDACGECERPPGRDPAMICVEHAGPLGEVQSCYLLCSKCFALLNRRGVKELPRLNEHSRQWAQLLALPAGGAA